MYYPTMDQVKGMKVDGTVVPVFREIVADLETPVSAFLKINEGGCSFLLESVEGGERVGRYSFIGTDPYKILKGDGKTDPLPMIATEMEKFKIASRDGLPKFAGGAVGYLSYETMTRFEDLPSPDKDTIGVPESLFMMVDTLLIFDHVTHKIKIMSHVHLKGDISENYRQALSRIDHLIDRLNQPLPPQSLNGLSQQIETSSVSSNFTCDEYKAMVEKVKKYIVAGEIIQVVPSQRMFQKTGAAPFDIYRALRTINPSPYMFYYDFKDFQIIGASPEILVRVEDEIATTRPLAGTRPRGTTPDNDIALEKELKADEKERAEHIMLVDLGRNDIGRVCQPGSVVVSDLMEVERYSHVMHLVTNVQGKLKEDMTSFDALRACFPAGTVSGAPKIRAMQIIAEVEPEKRGPYAGAAGYFSFTGDMDMAISIRTMVVKDGYAYTQAGGGVVYDSDPQKEYEETLNKAGALLSAINQAERSGAATGGMK